MYVDWDVLLERLMKHDFLSLSVVDNWRVLFGSFGAFGFVYFAQLIRRSAKMTVVLKNKFRLAVGLNQPCSCDAFHIA